MFLSFETVITLFYLADFLPIGTKNKYANEISYRIMKQLQGKSL